jgi:lysyl-tRNA synthetase class 2
VTQASRDSIGGTIVEIRGESIDLAEPWPRTRMIDAASEAIGIEVHPSMPVADLRAIADQHDVRWEDRWGSGKLIEELFEAQCEAGIVRPTFVTGHPTEISPLARADRNDPYLTERFEIFVDSRELGNGDPAVNAPVAQRARFDQPQAAKDAGDTEAGSVDEDYLRALEYGMPPTGGLGIGIDRVAMLLAGVDTIKEVILFPTLRPEVF